jgi:homoserine kinase
MWYFSTRKEVYAMSKVKVYSPGSIGNVGCGFDVFGLAIEAVGDVLEVEENNTGQLRITDIIGDPQIPREPEMNIVTVGARALLQNLNLNQGFDFKITKGVIAGSGLGSSGSSATAGVFAINELLGKPLTRQELVRFAAIGEQIASHQVHYDNVAPSMLGGFTAVRSNQPLEILQIAVPENLYLAMVRPSVVIKTEDAKKILADSIAINDAVSQFGNIAGLVIGMQNKDIPLIGRSVEDLLATPARSKLIPKYQEARDAALSAGACGFNISGSGPAMFAICDGKSNAEDVVLALKNVYQKDDNASYYVTQADILGTRTTN